MFYLHYHIHIAMMYNLVFCLQLFEQKICSDVVFTYTSWKRFQPFFLNKISESDL